ncbi:hypothetical protein C8Q74DRAFT_270673 [Fomes fomentarius]|nr:hypothetical protein C8Q74DRAFT_270673 [Fomes fomentarius]
MSDILERHSLIQSSSDTSLQRASEGGGQETPETDTARSACLTTFKFACKESACEPASNEEEEWPELLPGSWFIPSARERWKERRNDFTAEEKKRAWDKTARLVKEYSDELVKRWKEEIDTLLVYAGLFSAVLTALIVESYKLLSPPPPDPVLAALQQISVQLSSFSVNPPFVNSTQPYMSQTLPPAPPAPRWVIWLNALWFSSLIFSLSAASVGIMVKQWLNEYSTGLFGDSRHFARLRQHRLQNLERWQVAGIVAILPVLLQIALALFFGGLLVLLWMLNSDVAAVASALIGLLFAFTIGSSLIPIFRANCCYLSPPVYVFLNAGRSAKAAMFHLRRSMWNGLCHIRRFLKCSDDGSAACSDWVEKNLKDRSRTFTWRGHELKQISESSDDLDVAMVTKAYATTMDLSYLNDYATICFSDFLRPSQVGDCYRGLASEMDRHRLDGADIPLAVQSDLWLAIRHAADSHIDVDMGGLPAMDRFWEEIYSWRKIPPGASSHWRSHLLANALIQDNSSVAYWNVVHRLPNKDYDHCSNAVRRITARIVEQELQEHGQKAENGSLLRCSQVLQMLLSLVGASSSAQDAQDAETARVLRALTRHGLLCHFKCYTTEASKTLSFSRNDTDLLISMLRALCEDQVPDFMTPELVDVLVLVLEVHQATFHENWFLKKTGEPWILKLKRERDESRKNDTSCEEAQLSATA